MPKAYWIASVTVDDAETYARYRAANAAAFAKFGARFLVRGPEQQQVEGQNRPRSVVIEFPNLQAARDCYHSPEYQAAKAIRDPISQADMIIVGGYDGPQPA